MLMTQSQVGQRGSSISNPNQQGDDPDQRREQVGGGHPPEQQNQDSSRRGGMKQLPTDIRLRAAGLPSVIRTVEDAVRFIETQMPKELAGLQRWTFAHALLIEAQRTGKSRDMKAAIRQFKQALKNERWDV
jgi:hypothetical protein